MHNKYASPKLIKPYSLEPETTPMASGAYHYTTIPPCHPSSDEHNCYNAHQTQLMPALINYLHAAALVRNP